MRDFAPVGSMLTAQYAKTLGIFCTYRLPSSCMQSSGLNVHGWLPLSGGCVRQACKASGLGQKQRLGLWHILRSAGLCRFNHPNVIKFREVFLTPTQCGAGHGAGTQWGPLQEGQRRKGPPGESAPLQLPCNDQCVSAISADPHRNGTGPNFCMLMSARPEPGVDAGAVKQQISRQHGK